MPIFLQKVVLTYPPGDFMKSFEADAREMVEDHGFDCAMDKERGVLTITPKPEGVPLEVVFSRPAIGIYRECKFRVDLFFCPEGTKAVAITYPEEGWADREITILFRWYEVKGFIPSVFHEDRRLVLKPGNANFNDLPFDWLEQQGCIIGFIRSL